MARIFYSVMGEGRGHATRVRAIVEQLRAEHEISIFTYGHAFDLLEPVYRDSDVSVRQIPGLSFIYGNSRRVAWVRSLAAGARFVLRLPRHRTELEKLIARQQPDLLVTDFEPLLPRAARRCKVPFISLNHQHFLVVNDHSRLPGWLRRRAGVMEPFVRMFYEGQEQTIVSSFFAAPLRPEFADTLQVGVLLRPEFLNAQPEHGNFVLAYVRRHASPELMRALRDCGVPVRVYGMGDHPGEGNLTFHTVHERRFVEDLARCRALVSTAGNQLVGEALYLGKPVFALPEEDNFEQYINAHYLNELGTGESSEMRRVTAARVRGFLDRIGEFRARIVRARFNGNLPALAAIRAQLAKLAVPT